MLGTGIASTEAARNQTGEHINRSPRLMDTYLSSTSVDALPREKFFLSLRWTVHVQDNGG